MQDLTEKQIGKLKRLEKLVSSGNMAILEHLFDMEEKMEELRKELSPEIKEVLEKIKGKDGTTPIKGKDYFDGKDYILTEKDKKEIAKSITVPIVEKIVERTETVIEKPYTKEFRTETTVENPVTGKEIVAKINELETEPEFQIDIEHIKGWKDKLKNTSTVVVGGAASGGRIVKAHDLSSSLNGVLKTFSLPAFWRVISIHSSSSPFTFRPTTDYTTDGAGMTLTFTSEITAASTLNTGQTITVIYSEL